MQATQGVVTTLVYALFHVTLDWCIAIYDRGHILPV